MGADKDYEDSHYRFRTGFLMSRRQAERERGICAHCREARLPLPVEKQEYDVCSDCRTQILGGAVKPA